MRVCVLPIKFAFAEQEQAKRIWLLLALLDGQSGILIRGISRYAVISNEQSLFRCCKWTRVCMHVCVSLFVCMG